MNVCTKVTLTVAWACWESEDPRTQNFLFHRARVNSVRIINPFSGASWEDVNDDSHELDAAIDLQPLENKLNAILQEGRQAVWTGETANRLYQLIAAAITNDEAYDSWRTLAIIRNRS